MTDRSNFSNGDVTQNGNTFEEAHVLPKMKVLSGSLMLAGIVHMLVGMTGVIGMLMRYVGPLTVVPTLILVTIPQAFVLVKFCEPSWTVTLTTALSSIGFAMYLEGRNMPIPIWSKDKGFTIIHYPLQQVISVLLGIVVGLCLSAILTVTNVFSDDPSSPDYRARIDSSLGDISSSHWFYLPYPGQFGAPTFSVGIFITYLIPTLVSILDSIADYYACAKIVQAPPPPFHAMNRGLATEGFFSFLAGSFGAGHATTTYGPNIGLIGITKVGSLRVFQIFGLQLAFVAIIGKLSACFIAIPYPVIGGINIILAGSFFGIIFSNLSYVNLNSTRNVIVIGMALVLGLMIPHWAKQNMDKFETGIQQITSLVQILMTNANFIGGFVACLLDNTLPGTRKDRGMLTWMGVGSDEQVRSSVYMESTEVYDIPFITDILRKFKIAKYIPISPTFHRK
ncbi:Solute carrier family 23 member 2 [Mizuhopecten yessoensis]|uniref:Solute carrier family 23 member 2 n=2 Tax=Mizuhopecten yessoensis TaxID=6573 RepID=A0A210R6C4_MIZYE|nr:Solute carrier family 23 member 2 [Mizuhopecten yessoensis]